MGQIYSDATTVLIWIGLGDQESDLAMETIPGLVRDLEEFDQGSQPPFQVLNNAAKLDATRARALEHLFKRRWFSRVWTLQEAALGQTCQLLCGDKRIDFHLLLTLNDRSRTDLHGRWKEVVKSIGFANILENENPRYAMQHIHTISKLKNSRAQTSNRIEEPLYIVLARLRTCGCSDDRDRIYGLYEFLPTRFQHFLESELKPSEHTVASLYQSLASIGIVERKQTAFLSMAGLLEQDSSLNLPSWAPDWTYRGKRSYFTIINQDCVNKGKDLIYSAGGNGSSLDPTIEGDTLNVKGKILGSIAEINDSFSFMIPPTMNWPNYGEKYAYSANREAEDLGRIDACLALANRHRPLYTGADFIIACYRTLFTAVKALGDGSTPSTMLLASDSTLNEHFESLRTQQVLSLIWSMEPNNEAIKERRQIEWVFSGLHSFKIYIDWLERIRNQAGDTTEAFSDACKSRAFCVIEQTLYARQGQETEKRKFVGLVPDGAITGDVVAIIYGCPAPMLLRKTESSYEDGHSKPSDGPKYRLLGECFVHGFMNGEAVNMTEIDDQVIGLV